MRNVTAVSLLAFLVLLCVNTARAGETCTTYGNRTECRNDDGGYREEYQYGNRTEKQGDYE